ncbi:LysM peptidoglycan-binding domain-containing protein [Paraburkholderia hayleyella]|uniref:LysM peptidoglycan-binding domain-containing protein n=1 Tax=Paraburkholderia hayleyella TaxID=2152889 RepID=UPI0012909225|nr:LysM domain-containing protein [Paraburkholderia hayleyella]
MEYGTYVVAPGDTLSRIAQAHGTDVDQLATLNGIREPNYIYPGQKLKIPKQPAPQEDGDDFYSELWIRFVDAVGKPIVDLATRVVTTSGEYHFTTDDMGLIPLVQTQEKDDSPQIFVSKMGGGEKKVATLKPHPGVHQHTLRSPKHKINVPLRKHDGLPDHEPSKPVKLELGEVQHNRDLDGHPVINVGVECPNADNLRLGSNYKYRDYVIGAAKRAGITPQCVASIMNAEAKKLTTPQTKPVFSKGKAVLNSDGTPKMKTIRISTGEWDGKSAATSSSARGMTQFLDGTWIGLAVKPGTFLYQKLVGKGLVSMDGGITKFKLADRTYISAKSQLLLKYVHGKATSSDANVQSVLDMRFDAESAIYTAVDYGIENLSSLRASGFPVDELSDADKAKVIYLAHHLGPKDAPAFIKNEISSNYAKYLLTLQVGPTLAARFAEDNSGNYTKGHRDWLNGFVNGHIIIKTFSCDQSKIQEGRALLDITDSLAEG